MAPGPDLRKIFAAPEDALGVAILGIILFVTLIAVFYRYVLNDLLIWSEEVARFGLVAMTFIGAGTGFRTGAHIRIDLADRLPWVFARPINLAVALVSLGLTAYLAIQALRIMPVLANSRSAALGLPTAALYGVVALGLAGATLRIALSLLKWIATRARP